MVLCVAQTTAYLQAVCQLCHNDTELAHSVWIELFPCVWKILTDRMQHVRPSVSPVVSFLNFSAFLLLPFYCL